MSSSLSRGFYSGVIAGLFAGLTIFTTVMIEFSLVTEIPDITSVDFWMDYFVSQLGIHSIFGGIFGLMYQKLYGGIPSKGVKKGLVFGLMIGVLANLQYSMFFFLNWFLLTGEPELLEFFYVSGFGWMEGFLK